LNATSSGRNTPLLLKTSVSAESASARPRDSTAARRFRVTKSISPGSSGSACCSAV
jgi:hypothetical protein